MTALAWLIPAALVLGLVGLIAFVWSLKSGQFDDLDGAAYRILEDDSISEKTDDPNAQSGPRNLSDGRDKPDSPR